jgi:hypothetical protein
MFGLVASCDAPRDTDDTLGLQPFERSKAHGILLRDELHDAEVIAQVDKQEVAMIPPLVPPTERRTSCLTWARVRSLR